MLNNGLNSQNILERINTKTTTIVGAKVQLKEMMNVPPIPRNILAQHVSFGTVKNP